MKKQVGYRKYWEHFTANPKNKTWALLTQAIEKIHQSVEKQEYYKETAA